MEIIVIGARGFPGVQGGIEKHCEELYGRLAKSEDMKITALTITGYCRTKHWNNIDFVPLGSIGSKSLEKIWYALKAVCYAIKKNPDIIHFQGLNSALYIPLARLFGQKVVFTQHSRDYLYPKWGWIARMMLRLSESAALLSHKIIAVSKGIDDHLQKRTTKSVLIVNGTKIGAISLNDEEIHAYLGKYGIESRGYIFFAGRFTEEKAIEDLVHAYKTLDRPDIKLVLAGDADHETEYSGRLKTLARSLHGVVLTGFVSGKELEVLYSQCRLFVLPSKHEGLPIALLEAIGYGAEVLASDIEANTAVGFLAEWNFFRQGNVEDLRSKIAFLLDRAPTNEELQKRRRLLESEYNWDVIADMTRNLYVELCHNCKQQR